MKPSLFNFPLLSLRFIPIWRRNLLVWKKLAVPSMLGNLADPMIYLFGLGYGLGKLMPGVDGLPYINFLAAGTLCYSTMNSATFEALYSGFSRMYTQKTWSAILNTPTTLDDVMLAEVVWAVSKSLLSGLSILMVIWALGLSHAWLSLWAIPITIAIGICFAGMGLVVTALSPSYDFFLYYFTLVITPMMLVSGVFFPIAQLPNFLQSLSELLPLTHAVVLVRPLLNGGVPDSIALHLIVLLAYGAVGFYIATVLMRRRLLT